jgi:outer membrane protein assembly factor BamB
MTRHPVRWSVGAALLLGATLSLSAAGDWPLFRGNPLQTGVATEKLPDQFEVLWKFEAKDAIEGTAAIAGGTVYVGSMDENLYALDLADGRMKWKYKAGPIKAPVSAHGGDVYVGDVDGVFHRIDAARGEKVWTCKTDGEISSGANFAGDSVLFGSGDENLYRLSLKDGKVLWKFKVAGGPVMGTPAVVTGRTFAAGCDSTLHVIDLESGKESKGVELSGQVGAAAAVGGDRLFVGTMSNQVQAVDWKKGQVVWTFEAEKRAMPFYASVALTEKLVIAGSRDKRVHALDRDKGTEARSFLTGGKVDSSPVVAGGRVYVGSEDGHLYVLDAARGTQVQKIDLGSPVLASPAVGGGRLVIGTDKGVVYCLGAKK